MCCSGIAKDKCKGADDHPTRLAWPANVPTAAAEVPHGSLNPSVHATTAAASEVHPSFFSPAPDLATVPSRTTIDSEKAARAADQGVIGGDAVRASTASATPPASMHSASEPEAADANLSSESVSPDSVSETQQAHIAAVAAIRTRHGSAEAAGFASNESAVPDAVQDEVVPNSPAPTEVLNCDSKSDSSDGSTSDSSESDAKTSDGSEPEGPQANPSTATSNAVGDTPTTGVQLSRTHTAAAANAAGGETTAGRAYASGPASNQSGEFTHAVTCSKDFDITNLL